MSCKLCLEFNENSFEFTSVEAICRNIVEILRKHFPFCFKDDDSDGFVCEKCWWKVEMFNNFYNSVAMLHQNVFADALIKFGEGDQFDDQQHAENFVKIEEPSFIITEQQPEQLTEQLTEQQPSINDMFVFVNDADGNTIGYRCAVPRCRSKRCFPTKQKIRVHIKKKHSQSDLLSPKDRKPIDVPVTCNECGKVCKNDKQYRNHYERLHIEIQCDLCDAWVKNKHHFRIHYVYRHLQSKRRVRGKPTDSISSSPPRQPAAKSQEKNGLFEMGNHYGGSLEHVTEFQCTEPDCRTKTYYQTQSQLDRHHRDLHSDVQCDICHKSFRKYYLSRHKRNVHSFTKETVCDICGMGCKTKASYKAHYVTMHTVQERIQCDICGLWLKNKYHFRGHYLTVHFEAVPVTCLVCGHTAPNKKALDGHQRSHRPDFRSFTCTACGRGFSSNAALRSHMLTHSKNREPQRCNICSRSFCSKYGLKRHMCTKPTERTCKCPYCDRTYCSISGVRTHLRRSHRAEENMRKESIKLKKLANLEKIKNNAQLA